MPTDPRNIFLISFKIGKSKVLPKVSVLVSNRTIRNNISTKKQNKRKHKMKKTRKNAHTPKNDNQKTKTKT